MCLFDSLTRTSSFTIQSNCTVHTIYWILHRLLQQLCAILSKCFIQCHTVGSLKNSLYVQDALRLLSEAALSLHSKCVPWINNSPSIFHIRQERGLFYLHFVWYRFKQAQLIHTSHSLDRRWIIHGRDSDTHLPPDFHVLLPQKRLVHYYYRHLMMSINSAYLSGWPNTDTV